jgi:hypothetical protein
MSDDPRGGATGDRPGRIQGAYDYCDGESAFIIADVTTDDAWMAIDRDAAASVETHR